MGSKMAAAVRVVQVAVRGLRTGRWLGRLGPGTWRGWQTSLRARPPRPEVAEARGAAGEAGVLGAGKEACGGAGPVAPVI